MPTIDPLWGEGIHTGMRSARAVAAAADHCLTRSYRDTSAERLSVYDTLWHREAAPNMQRRLLLTELLYLADDARYDRFMRDLHEAAGDVLARANQGDWRAMLRLLHLSDLPMLTRLVRSRIAGRAV